MRLPENLPYALTIAALLAGPSVILATVSEITDNPLLRPFSVTEERLAAAQAYITAQGPYVRARIYWYGPAGGYDTPEDLRDAIRQALLSKGVGAHVAVLPGERFGRTMLDLRAGRNAFGPFPVAEAAQHVVPAVHAAHLAHAMTSRRGLN